MNRMKWSVAMGVALLASVAWAQGGLEGLVRIGDAQSHRESSCNKNLQKNNDSRPIEPGETLVLGDLKGPGVITHLWCTVGTPNPFYPRDLVLRMYWEGSEKPSVEVPLGDFFATGYLVGAEVNSVPVAVSSNGRARNCYWRMPFRKAAKITVTNENTELRINSFYFHLDWESRKSLPKDLAYFHAQYRQAYPTTPGDYTVLETTGKGHYVGTVLSVLQTEIGWFGEGDDFFFIDGEELPSLRGTGTEDYFSDAWGFRAFTRPYYGVSVYDGSFPGDTITAYRWHIEDPVYFSKSLRLMMEHRGSVVSPQGEFLANFVERPDWYSTVAYWYQNPIAFSSGIPTLAERRPPVRLIPAASLGVEAKPEKGLAKEKIGVGYLPGVPDATLDFAFEITETGTYQLRAFMPSTVVSGVYQAFLDGQPLRSLRDFNGEGDDPLWVSFDTHRLEKGTHHLRFEGRGLSPKDRSLAPKMYHIGMDYLSLMRLEDLKGYGEAQRKLIEERAAQK